MKIFCVMPWYSQEINLSSGQETVCCWIKGNIAKSELQQQFLSDQRPQACGRCWQSEDTGIESRRQMENRFLDFKMDRDIGSLDKDAEQGIAKVNMYQLFLGSTCNSTCVTCDSGASSAWRSLQGTAVSIRPENLRTDQYLAKFFSTIDWSQAKRFNLLGGEPLLMDRSFDILRKLLQVNNTDCRVSFVTNGSVTLSVSQIELLRKFSDISCCVSIDGVGKSFEYIRYPLSWPKLLTNMAQYREIFSEVVVSFTVSNLNYHERPEIINWFQDQKLLYIENYVTYPPWFRFDVNPSHELWPRFVQEISYQDDIKGINIENYLPHIADLIQKTWR